MASATMHAAVLYGKEDVRIESVPIPQLRRGELLVHVRTALTCGTDVKVFRRGYHARMIQPPSLFGHELAGDVVALGEDVRNFQVGQRVVAANSAPCGQCFFCSKGQPNLCEDLLFNNGAYAEFIRIPERIAQKNTYVIPEHLNYKDAALAEPLACAVRGLDECRLQPGDTLVILGLGPIGLMFVRLAKFAYGARVLAAARRPEQFNRAMMLGADAGISMADPSKLTNEVKSRTNGRGADVVIEATGHPDSWELATKLVRKGGIVNFFGGCPTGTRVGLDTALLHYSEITCKSTFHHTPEHMRRALAFIAAGNVLAEHLVHHVEPLSHLPQVLSDLAHRAHGQIKTAIIPD